MTSVTSEAFALPEQVPKRIRDHFFWFHEFIPRHRRDPRPPFRSWSTKDLVDYVQLVNLVGSLEHRLFGE